MKFFASILAGCALVASVSAQGIYIAYPAAGSTITKNTQQVVQVVRPNSIQGGTEVGLVISINSCPGGTCPPASSQIGTILYNGPFSPQYHGPGQQYQNFTITVPDISGPAELIATRFFVIGAGPSPTIGGADNQLTVA